MAVQSIDAPIDVVPLPTFSPEKYGGASFGDGITDDHAAFQSALDAANDAGGGVVLVGKPSGGSFKITDKLDMSGFINVQLRALGARSEIKDDASFAKMIYTGTADRFIDIKHSRGLTFEGIDVRHNSSSFVGDLMSSNFTGAGTVTYNLTVRNSIFGSTDPSIRTARSGMYLAGIVRANLSDNGYYWADYGIIGYSAASGDGSFSTAVNVNRCWFNELDLGGVCNPHQQWSITNNVFEPLQSGNAGGIVCGAFEGGAGDGVLISGNGFWDVTSGSGAWVLHKGYGFDIVGNFAVLGSGGTFVKSLGGDGLHIGGGRILGSAGATVVDANGSTITHYQLDDDISIDGGITREATMGNVTRSSPTFGGLTLAKLIGGGSVGSPIAGTGAGTAPTTSILGNQMAGRIVVTTGTSPSTSANVITSAWASVWPSTPSAVIVTPCNAAAAALTGNAAVYEDRSQRANDRFVLKVGSGGLAAATTYEWEFIVIV